MDQQGRMKNIECIAFVVEEEKAGFTLKNIFLDEVRENEYLIEMKYSGICHTDLVAQNHGSDLGVTFPIILGHEGAGYVREIGSKVKNNDIHVGDFVLLSINYCGECKQCRNNVPACCHNGGMLHMGATHRADKSTPGRMKDGRSVKSQFFGQSSFAAMSVVDETCVIKFDGDPQKAAIFAACGCGFQTGAGTVLNVLKPERDDSIVVFGLGSVGLTALMAAKYLGVRQIIAVDIIEERLSLAKELGATELVDSTRTPDFVNEIIRITRHGADYCIDCTGATSVIQNMVNCLAKRGTAAVVGIPPAGQEITVDPLKILFQARRLVGCLEGESIPQQFVPELVKMQMTGKFPLEKLCNTYPYQNLQQALSDMRTGKVIKPVLVWF